MIQYFDPQNLRALREEIQPALNAIAAKHGIKLQLKNMTYDPHTATFRAPLEGTAGGAGDAKKKQALEMASIYGVDASEPSTHPRASGAELIEFRSKAKGKPWVYRLDGKDFITTDAGLKVMWPAKKAEGQP